MTGSCTTPDACAAQLLQASVFQNLVFVEVGR